jgi:hypothetical protein
MITCTAYNDGVVNNEQSLSRPYIAGGARQSIVNSDQMLICKGVISYLPDLVFPHP